MNAAGGSRIPRFVGLAFPAIASPDRQDPWLRGAHFVWLKRFKDPVKRGPFMQHQADLIIGDEPVSDNGGETE